MRIRLKNFGWIPDAPDQRDYLYKAIQLRKRLAKKVDISKYCSIVENQGNLGSCTACALAGNLEFLDKKIDNRYFDVSRLFIYFNERAMRDEESFDSGASLRDGIKTLRNLGSCQEKIWPYVIKKFSLKPPLKCYKQARQYLISSYHRINNLREMLACLAEGFPFVFGFTVYESFLTKTTAKTGVVNLPSKDERALGGHAVLAVGYDQKTKRFLARNSWGAKWGQKGYFTMPFAYLESLAADFWTIRR